MSTTNLKRLAATVSLCTGLAIGAPQLALAQGALENGDFETGTLEGWGFSGDAGVSNQNVLDGNFSAFITNGAGSIGETNSFLYSDFVVPTKKYQAISVSFRVRYKTDEDVLNPNLFWEDPFHAELVTGQGAVELLTVKTDGISWRSGLPLPLSSTVLRDLETGKVLSSSIPIKPTFVPDPNGLYAFQSHTLKLTDKVSVGKGSCDPVRIKFSIQDWVDTLVDSAAFIDDVKITFVPSFFSEQCPQTLNVDGATQEHVGAK